MPSLVSILPTLVARLQLSTLPGTSPSERFFELCISTDYRSGVCKELQPRRVSVNSVAPGPMDTRESLLAAPMFPVYAVTDIMRDSLLLPPRIPRSRRIPQIQRPERPSHRSHRYRAYYQIPVRGGCLDHGADHLCQRWLHDSVDSLLSRAVYTGDAGIYISMGI